MLTVLSYLKPYRGAAFIAILLVLVELSVELWHPLLMARVIDEGIMQSDFSAILKWGGIMVGISFLAFIAGVTNSFYSSHVSQGFGYDIREELYNKVQSFSFANFNKFPTSSLITRLTNDVIQVQNLIFMCLRIALRAPLFVVGGIILAFMVNAKLALILAVTVPFLVVFLVIVMNLGVKLYRSVQSRLDKVNGVMRENLTGMRLIKAFFRWKHEVKRFTTANENLMGSTVKALRLVEITMPVLLLVMNLSIIFVLWFGSFDIHSGSMQIGEIVAIVNYGTRITFSLSVVSFIIMGYAQAKASASRIEQVLDTEIDLVDAEDADPDVKVKKGKISFTNVSFRYPGTDVNVLENISFHVEPGQTVAILGATGSGKTSLFQLIPRLYDANEGKVLIDQQDITKFKLGNLRGEIGFVPQDVLLFSGSVKENIGWGKEGASMDEIIQAAKDAQIHETIIKLPEQYDTLIGQRGVNLSGGQKQRLSIARALLRKPKILLLDDCTSALDLKTEALLLDALKGYTCTTLIITQKISTVIEADSILLIEDGKLLAQGNHQKLLRQSLLYQKIFQSQYGEEKLQYVKAVE